MNKHDFMDFMSTPHRIDLVYRAALLIGPWADISPVRTAVSASERLGKIGRNTPLPQVDELSKTVTPPLMLGLPP
jgi:hypothetical protein